MEEHSPFCESEQMLWTITTVRAYVVEEHDGHPDADWVHGISKMQADCPRCGHHREYVDRLEPPEGRPRDPP